MQIVSSHMTLSDVNKNISYFSSGSTEAAQSNQIDKMLNPEKISQYKLDVMKTESDIRA